MTIDVPKPDAKKQTVANAVQSLSPKSKSAGLSYTEKHRLEKLPDIITRLEAEIAKLEEFLCQPDLYQSAPLKFQKATDALVERQAALAEAEDEWMMLKEKSQS